MAEYLRPLVRGLLLSDTIPAALRHSTSRRFAGVGRRSPALDDRLIVHALQSGRHPSRSAGESPGLSGGRTWWGHLEVTRINIDPIILRKKIEDLRSPGGFVCPFRGRIARSDIHRGSELLNRWWASVMTISPNAIASRRR